MTALFCRWCACKLIINFGCSSRSRIWYICKPCLPVSSLYRLREEYLDIPDPTSLILGPYIKPDRDVSFVYFGLIDPTYDSMPLQVSAMLQGSDLNLEMFF